MKLNVDCIREILLVMEDIPFNDSISMPELREVLSDFSSEDIDYSCIKLKEAGYINAVIKELPEETIVLKLRDITFLGHQFLNNIRSDDIWQNTKAVSQKIGSSSINALSQISAGIVTTIIKSQLGLT